MNENDLFDDNGRLATWVKMKLESQGYLEKILLKLKAETEKICADAVKDKGEIGGAVNWADLHCHWSEFYRDSEGDSGFRVYIEESAPYNVELQKYISDKLNEAGFINIEIITEW